MSKIKQKKCRIGGMTVEQMLEAANELNSFIFVVDVDDCRDLGCSYGADSHKATIALYGDVGRGPGKIKGVWGHNGQLAQVRGALQEIAKEKGLVDDYGFLLEEVDVQQQKIAFDQIREMNDEELCNVASALGGLIGSVEHNWFDIGGTYDVNWWLGTWTLKFDRFRTPAHGCTSTFYGNRNSALRRALLDLAEHAGCWSDEERTITLPEGVTVDE